MTHRSTNTVVPSVSTTDNNDVLALRVDIVAVLKLGVKERLRVHLDEDIRVN